MNEMKNSEIGWVNEIPYDWEVIKGKYLFKNHKEIVGSRVNNFERLALTLNGVIKRSKEDNEGLQPENFNNYQVLKKNELVFKLIDLKNISTSRVGLSNYVGIVSPAYIILSCNNKIYPKYAEKYYLMMWMHEVFNALGDSGVRSNLSATDLLNLPVIVPSYENQIKIANFIEAKEQKINKLLEKINMQINLMESEKKSLIIDNVSKNMFSSKDLIDSGIEYIGMIPLNWKVKKGKYLFKYLQKPIKQDDEVITCFRDGEVTLRSKRREEGFTISEKEIGYQGIDKGDLVVHGMDGFAGSIGISDSRGKASPVLNVLETDQSKLFYMYLLRSMAYKGLFIALSTGIRVRTCDTNWAKLKELYYVVPPINEQEQIAYYLSSELKKINNTIFERKKLIKLLINYKKTIFYEYVTGKKEPNNE